MKLLDICDLIVDCPHSTAKNEGKGYPLIRTPNIGRGRLNLDSVHRVSKQVYLKRNQRATPQVDDLILAREAPVGNVAIIQEEKVCLGQRTVLIRPNKEKVDANFLVYYLLAPKQQHLLISSSNGATVSHLNMSTIRNLEINLPEMSIQKKIGRFLSKIDDLIGENEKINKNLIQQSQALYSAWFEQFLPFDGSMPSDWRIGTLGDIATIKTNSFNPQKNPGVMLEHYSIPAYDEQHFPFFESSDNVKSNKYILTDNSVLASKLNPDTKRIWRPMCLTGQAVCSTEFIVFEANNSAHRDFLFSIIDSQFFSDWMCAHTTGSTNSRQRTTPSTTLEFKVNVAPDDVIDEFCASVTPMYDLISQKLLENQGLASLRDSLLPKLMSGEIDVSNIEL